MVKTHQDADFIWADQKVNIRNNSLLMIKSADQQYDFNLMSGAIRIESKAKFKVFGYEIQSGQAQYIKVADQEIRIFDSESLDLKIFAKETLNAENEKVYILRRSEFLTRQGLVKYLSDFYSGKSDFKSALSSLAKKYQKRVDLDSKKQAEFLRNQQAREIASVENLQKQRAASLAQMEIDRKKSRALFFMRTFRR